MNRGSVHPNDGPSHHSDEKSAVSSSQVVGSVGTIRRSSKNKLFKRDAASTRRPFAGFPDCGGRRITRFTLTCSESCPGLQRNPQYVGSSESPILTISIPNRRVVYRSRLLKPRKIVVDIGIIDLSGIGVREAVRQ